MNHTKRQNELIRLLQSKSLDALLIRKRENISYLVGTKGEDSILFISGSKNFLITDSRYKEEYAKSIENCHLRIVKDKDVHMYIQEICRKTRSNRVGFESNNFSYLEYIGLKKRLRGKTLIPVKDIVESLRIIKDPTEIRYIKDACKYGCEVMNYALKIIRPALSETALKERIEIYITKRGIKKADFDIIVASGKNASMPHASVSEKRIKKQEMVVIDLGTMNYGYNCDLTRTVFLGRIDREYLRIYNIILAAQKKAIENIKPGIEAKYIDTISRQYISNKGLGRYFIHNLGHGIGLETHEEPRISRNSNAILEKNMVITVEPGVYIPGWGGVRIEDTLLVTKNGCEILTKACRKVYVGRD